MKRIIMLLSIAIVLVSSCGECKKDAKVSDNKITLSGTVKFDDPANKMQILKRDGFNNTIIAEFDINEDGTYSYEWEVEEPGVYTLNCKKWEVINFWAEDEDIEVHFRGLDTAKMKIKNPKFYNIGSAGPLNEVMNQLNFLEHRNYQLMIELSRAAYASEMPNESRSKLTGTIYETLGNDIKQRVMELTELYPDRNSILAVLGSLRDTKPEEAAVIAKTVEKFEKTNPTFAPFIKYKEALAEAKYQRERLAIGKPAPDFTFKNLSGEEQSLSDFKGKMVVLDFWASWCGPCIAEMPHLKEIGKKFAGKDIEIISVSIDKNEKAWRDAIAKEGMTWTQLLAPKAGKDIMKEYQFTGIPYILLIDREGNIVAKNLRGDKMMKMIESQF